MLAVAAAFPTEPDVKKHSVSTVPHKSEHWLPALTAIGSLVLIGLMLSTLRNPVALDDGMRHLAMARVLVEQGLLSGGWGRFFYEGYFSVHDSNPWFLADLTYVPLAHLPTEIALKLHTLISIAALTGAFMIALRQNGVRGAAAGFFLFALLLGEKTFTGRLLLGRPYVLMSAILLLMYAAVLRRSTKAVFLLMILSTLFSHLFVFPAGVCTVGCIIMFLADKKKDAQRLLVAMVTGTLLGLLLHPYKWGYVHYMATVFFRIPFMKSIGIGAEFSPGAIQGFFLPLTVGIAALLLIQARTKSSLSTHDALPPLFSVALTLPFLAGFLLWERFVDFLWPFCVLLIAGTVRIHPQGPDQLIALLSAKQPHRRTMRVLIAGFVAFQLVSFGLLTWKPLLKADGVKGLEQFSRPLAGIPAGSKILNLQWDSIPLLLNARSDLLYARGMDPTFTFATDPDIIWLLDIPYQDAAKRIDPIIDTRKWLTQLLHQYPSDYIAVRKWYTGSFAESLKSERGLRLHGESPAFAVYEVRPSLKTAAENFVPTRTDTSLQKRR